MKKVFLKSMILLCALIVGSSSVWGEEVVAYTLTPASGSNNSYASNCDIAISGITWNLTGNSAFQPWRIGGKSLSNVDRALYSKTAILDNITKIVVTHGAASSITVNSMTVIVSANSDFSSPISTLTPSFTANNTVTINRPDGKSWANCYYKFIYNVTVSGSSNKFLEFTRATFYKEVSSSAHSISVESPLTGGSVIASTTSEEEGKTITLTAVPSAGYNFNNIATNWSVVDASSNPVTVTPGEGKTATFTMPNEAVTVSATFTEIPTHNYIISATNGTIKVDNSEEDGSAYEGVELSLKATPTAGYEFTSWNVYKTGEDATKVTVVANKLSMPAYDITVSAIFTALPVYSINKADITNGTITVESSAYVGKDVELSATPNIGYALSSWDIYKTDDPSTKISVSNGKFTMPAYAITVAASFITSITDNMTLSTTGVSGSSYGTWINKTLISSAIYSGCNAGGNNSIQLRSNNSDSGIFNNASGGKAKKVVITWNSNTTSGRALDVYGKNTPYNAVGDLYESSSSIKGAKLGSIAYGTSTELTISGDYAYIGLRSSSGAMYIDNIAITWAPCRDIVVSAAEWATLYLPFAVDIPSDVQAYYVSAISGSTLTLTKLDAVIPANTGVLINASAGTYTFEKSSSTPAAPATNYLKGSVTNATTIGGDYYYRLAWDGSDSETVGFSYGAENGASFTNEANKAYLVLSAAESAAANAPLLRFIIDEENNATGIEKIDNTEKAKKFIENGRLLIQREGVVYDAIGRVVR